MCRGEFSVSSPHCVSGICPSCHVEMRGNYAHVPPCYFASDHYRDVVSGKWQMEQFTPEQRRRVEAALARQASESL